MSGDVYTRDLSLVPDISFSFVEKFIQKSSSSSGREQMTKGFKYYSEEFVHSVAVYQDETGCLVKGKCFRSQKKNDSPHDVKILITHDNVHSAFCSCTIGKSGHCGHITALLYQLAHYKMMKLVLIPTDVAKTSLPQTWHVPRGEKLKGDRVDNLVIQGYDRQDPQRATQGIRSTLYNPSNVGETFNMESFLSDIGDMDILFPTVASKSADMVHTGFGNFPKGSVISYQQKKSSDQDYLLNLIDVNDFPQLPIRNVMETHVPFVLQEPHLKLLQSLTLTEIECVKIEESTRSQSKDPRWHKLRSERLTASNAGEIAKRRADGQKLAERMKAARSYQSAAMKRGVECESTAAQAYSQEMENRVNLYPCGVIVSPYCPWLAATPDRKVYCPSRNPPYGLLEIKCPNTDDLQDVKCLKEENGGRKLKTTDNYHYQIQMQMAVTGLSWCDFYVWLENASHLETVWFDAEFWQGAKDKLDAFFLQYYLS